MTEKQAELANKGFYTCFGVLIGLIIGISLLVIYMRTVNPYQQPCNCDAEKQQIVELKNEIYRLEDNQINDN